MGITFIPTDFTGKAVGNLRTDEVHQLITVANRVNRAFVCKHGAFYSQTMRVRDASGRLLTQGVDYKTVYHYADVSKLTGKEVMGFVIVTNQAVQSPVRVTYQALGGPFSISADELRELLDAIDESKFPFVWGDIIGKPTTYVPSPHSHEYWQLYGLETTVTEINRLAAAWPYGNKAVINENKGYADDYLARAKTEIDKYQAAVNAHLRDFQNPHRLTPAQVQRELLNNWGMSGVFHIADPANANTYLPIAGVVQIMAAELLPTMDAHLKNFNNAHNTTAEQVGAFTIGYVDNVLATKLDWGDPAVNSVLFGGIAEPTFYAAARTAIPAANVVSGKFQHAQLGTGWDGNDPSNWCLTGNQKWTRWSEFLKVVNEKRGKIANIGQTSSSGQSLNILNSVFSNPVAWPVGSLAIGSAVEAPAPDNRPRVIYLFRRTASGWILQ